MNDIPRPDLMVQLLEKHVSDEDVAALDFKKVASDTRKVLDFRWRGSDHQFVPTPDVGSLFSSFSELGWPKRRSN